MSCQSVWSRVYRVMLRPDRSNVDVCTPSFMYELNVYQVLWP